jgi:hypothetical protein
MRYNGYLDSNDGWTVLGWAFDGARPDEPVEVEFMNGTEQIGAVTADEFRTDLRVTRGAGSGQHLASVLQEGRENASIDAGLGFIWSISAPVGIALFRAKSKLSVV